MQLVQLDLLWVAILPLARGMNDPRSRVMVTPKKHLVLPNHKQQPIWVPGTTEDWKRRNQHGHVWLLSQRVCGRLEGPIEALTRERGRSIVISVTKASMEAWLQTLIK